MVEDQDKEKIKADSYMFLSNIIECEAHTTAVRNIQVDPEKVAPIKAIPCQRPTRT